MMRRLAWWGISMSMSAKPSPAFSIAAMEASPITCTAKRKTSLPFI
jgi:hypothetical protein